MVISLLCLGIVFVIAGHYLNEMATDRERQLRQVALDIRQVLWAVELNDNLSIPADGSNVVGNDVDEKINEAISRIDPLLNGNNLTAVLWSPGSNDKLLELRVYLQEIMSGIAHDSTSGPRVDPRLIGNIRESHEWIGGHVEQITDRRNFVVFAGEVGVVFVIFFLAFSIIYSEEKHRKEERVRGDRLREEVKLRTVELEASLSKNKDQLESLARANARLVILNTSLERLQDASKYFKFGENAAPLMGRVVRDVVGLTDAQCGFMALIDAEGVVKSVFAAGLSDDFSTGLIGVSSAKGILSLVFGEAGSVRMDDLSFHSDALSEHEECRDMRNLLGIPIVVGGFARGVICLFDKKNGLNFDEDDEAILGLFAIDLSHAMDRLAMLEELHGRNEELEAEKEMQKRLIVKLQQAQTQLLQTEKMASIGQLAAGVAHEINNPVGYISSNLNSLKQYLGDLFKLLDAYERYVSSSASSDQPALRHISEIKGGIDVEYLKKDLIDLTRESMEGADRVIKIVRDLKEFSHVDQTEFEIADLHKGLDSTLNIAHNEIKYKVEVIKEYGVLPVVECVPTQINQVFMNIIVNAAHAIEEKGTIWVKTGAIDDRVWIEISDTGKGINPENLSKIYDPFFTTKPVGKGTGLGLSITYGIIAKHNGKIEVESKLGVGTSFRIWLPVRHVATENESSLAAAINSVAGGI